MSLASNIQELYSSKLLALLTTLGEIANKQGLRAYVVGGFVRDLLLKKQNFDIDIMVEGDALPFATKVGQQLNAECKLIERFHTAHVYSNDLTIDFSSARKEYYPNPGELPVVTFSNLKDDLYRRDFSINAMAISISPNQPFELIDLFHGYLDLTTKKIRILHPRSFIDDPTRLYRALRFADRFKFSLDSNTEYLFDKAIELNIPQKLSIKRISAEIEKVFEEKNPLTLLSKYQNAGLLQYFHKSFTKLKNPNLSFCVVPAMTTRLRKKFSKISETAIFWSLLLCDIDFLEAQLLVNNSGLPHSVINQIIPTLLNWKNITLNLYEAKTNIEIFNILKVACPEAIALIYLKSKNTSIENKLKIYIDQLCSIKPTITGEDLIKAGIKPGPQIRTIFNKIIEKKIEGIELSRKDELNIARTI